jgi:hypothetical protein
LPRQKKCQTMQILEGVGRLKFTNQRHMVEPVGVRQRAGVFRGGSARIHGLQITTYPEAEFVQYPHVR